MEIKLFDILKFGYRLIVSPKWITILWIFLNGASAQNVLDLAGINHGVANGSAYSLRRLSSNYLGKAIQVSKGANDTLSIGFLSSGELDTNALKTYAGSNNVFVTIWYDQTEKSKNLLINNSGNVYLVTNGKINYINGRPALYFDGGSWLETTTNVIDSASKNFTINAVLYYTSLNNVQRVFDQGTPTNESYKSASMLKYNTYLYFSGTFNDITYTVNSPVYLSSSTIVVSFPSTKGSVNESMDSNSTFPNGNLFVAKNKAVVGQKSNNDERF